MPAGGTRVCASRSATENYAWRLSKFRFPSNRFGPFEFAVTRHFEILKICTTSFPEFYFRAENPTFLRSRTSFSLRRLPLKHFYVTLHNRRKLFRDSFRDAVCLKLTHDSCVIPSASVFSAFAQNHIKKRNLHLMSVYPLDINFFFLPPPPSTVCVTNEILS